MLGHLNVRPEVVPPAVARASVLIHFADGKQPPLPALGEAMHRSKLRDAGVPLIVVLPRGSFAQTRSAVEASLGLFRSELALPLVITEDYEGGWTRAFSAAGGTATFLLGPEGEIAWKHEGHVDVAGLATALDRHAVVPRRRLSRLLRTALRAGERIPDLVYDVARGQHLRGRPICLLFCKSWSTPSIGELVRLQRRHERAGGRGPVVLAIADGEAARHADEVVRAHGLGFLVRLLGLD